MGWFYNLLILWIFIGLSTFIFLIFSNTVVPYGRHSSSKWGLMIDNRRGWFWMELPALLIMPVIILTSPVEKNNNKHVFIMDGHGGQTYTIDFDKGRIVATMAIHRDFNWKKIAHSVIKKGK